MPIESGLFVCIVQEKAKIKSMREVTGDKNSF